MEKKDKVYYPCFSLPEKDFLMSKKLRYLLKCRHWETDVPMFIFMYDKEGLLDKYLEEWKTIRKLSKNNEVEINK